MLTLGEATLNVLSSSNEKALSLILINLDLAVALTLQGGSKGQISSCRTIIWYREKFSKCQLILTRFLKLL